jgi:glycosyltransferase involved in cell wall biosynthesis
MKIVIINNIYPPYDRGGAEQVVVQNVQGLVAAGHEVVVVTTTPGAPEIEIKSIGEKKYQIHRIHPQNLFFYTNAHEHGPITRALWHVLDIFNVSAAISIKKILADQKPDIVHTHNLMGLSFLVPLVIRHLGLRHIQTVHDVQLVEPSAMILKAREKTWRYNGWPTRLYTALMRHLFGSPHVVISPSQFLRDFYLSRGFFQKSRVEVLRNPLTFPGLISPQIARASDNTFRFLYVGQIESHKGVVELIQAFKEIADTDTELHIVGGADGGAPRFGHGAWRPQLRWLRRRLRAGRRRVRPREEHRVASLR